MTYDALKTLWTTALDEAGVLSPYDCAEEAIDLRQMDRTYAINIGGHGAQLAEPFHLSSKLDWRWNALQAARIATTEEDLLTELHGRDAAAEMATDRPWLRVDIKLRATLPWGKPQRMPSRSVWKRFATSVATKIAPLFPPHEIEFNEGTALLGWCGQPEAVVNCDADGQILLTAVHLEAWQPIMLVRTWDDPDREPDPNPGEELAAFASRIREAMQHWGEATTVLRIVNVS